jgi:TP901 family phage tail tape measure protein
MLSERHKNRLEKVASKEIRLSIEIDDNGTIVLKNFGAAGETAFGKVEKAAGKAKKAVDGVGKTPPTVPVTGLDALSKKFDALGAKATTMGKNMSLAFSTSIGAFGMTAFKAADAVDDAYDRIKTRTGETGKAGEALLASFKKVAVQVPQSFAITGEAIAEVRARFGLAGKDLEGITEKFLIFSRVNKVDVATAITDLSKLMGQLGLSTKDIPGMMDKLTFAAEKSGISAGNLQKILVSNFSTLKELGYSFDQMLAVITAFEKAGGDATSGIWSLRMAMLTLSSKGVPDARKALEEYMVKIKKAGDATTATKIAHEIFGRQAVKMASDIRSGKLDIDAFTKSMKDSGGTMDRINKSTMSFGEIFDVYKNKILGALAPVGDLLREVAEKVFPLIGAAVEKAGEIFEGFSKPLKIVVVAVGALAAAAGPAALAFGLLAKAFSSSIDAIKGAHTKLKAGLDLVKTGFKSLGGAIQDMHQPLDMSKDKLGKLALVGAAAFIGWQIGRAIADILGLDKVVEGACTKLIKLLHISEGLDAEFGTDHAEHFKIQTEAIGEAAKVSGHAVQNFHEAIEILAEKYKKSGTTGSASLDALAKGHIACEEAAKKHGEETKKTGSAVGALTDEQKKFAAAIGVMPLKEVNKEIEGMGAAYAVARAEGMKNADMIIKVMGPGMVEHYAKLKPILDAYGLHLPKALAEFMSKCKDTVLAMNIQKATIEALFSAQKELGAGIIKMSEDYGKYNQDIWKDLGKTQDALREESGIVLQTTEEKIRARRDEMEWYEAGVSEHEKQRKELEKQEWEEVDAINKNSKAVLKAYDEKRRGINDYYEEEKRKWDDLVEQKKREIQLISVTETAKMNIEKGATAEAKAAAAAAGLEKLDALKKEGEHTIEMYQDQANMTLDKWKESFVDPTIAHNMDLIKSVTTSWEKYFDWWESKGAESAKAIGKEFGLAGAVIATALAGLSDMFKNKAADTYAAVEDLNKKTEEAIAKSPAKADEIMKAAAKKRSELMKVATRQEAGGELLGGLGQLGLTAANYAAAQKAAAAKTPGYVAPKFGAAGGLAEAMTPLAGGLGGALGQLISGKKTTYAGTGSAVGGALGGLLGPVGGLIGSALGGLLGGLFGKKEKKTEEQRQAEELQSRMKNVTNLTKKLGDVSEDTAKKIAEESKKYGEAVATHKNMADVIKDVGVNEKNVNDLWVESSRVLGDYKSGLVTAAEASKSAGESFTAMVEGAKKLGTEGSKAMTDFIKDAKASGLKIPEITDYINEQLGVIKKGSMSAAAGLAAMAKEPGMTEEGLKRLSRQALVTFNAMIENGATYSEAAASMGDALDGISAAYKKMGIASDANIAKLMHIRDVTTAHQDLMDAIDGNKAVLDALANSGALTQQVLDDSAKSANEYYTKLVDAGLSGNEALSQMAPTLQRLRYLAKEHGLQLDDTTKSLIKMAEEQGLMKEEELSTNDIMLAGFGEIIKALGGDVPEAMQKAMGKMKDFGKEGSDAAGTIQQKSEDAAGAVDGIGESAKRATQSLKDMADAQNNLGPEDAPEEKKTYGQGGGSWKVVDPQHTFIAHRGERVNIYPEGSGDGGGVIETAGGGSGKIEDLLGQLLNAVKEGMAPTLEPIVLEKRDQTIIDFVFKQLKSGNEKIPATSIGG